MKKIAFLHYTYYPISGGVENLLKFYTSYLANFGYQIKVLVGQGKEDNPNIKIITKEALQPLSIINPVLYEAIKKRQFNANDYKTEIGQVYQILETELKDYQNIVFHNLLSIKLNPFFSLALVKYIQANPDKNFLNWIHDHNLIVNDEIKTDHLPDDIVGFMKTTFPNVKLISISDKLKQQLNKIYPDQAIQTIYDGISLEKIYKFTPFLARYLMAHKILNKSPLILLPHNILPRKNIEYALDIAAVLKKDYPGILLMLTGGISIHSRSDSSKEAYLQMLLSKIDELKLKENILFIDLDLKKQNYDLKLEDIYSLYQLSDLVFYLSKQENFGMPVVESSLFMKPAFTLDLAVFKEIAGEKLNYLPKNNPLKAADSVKKVLQENIALQLLASIKKRFILEKIVDEDFQKLLV